MTRRTSTLELALPARDKASPAWRWLYESLRQQILAGSLRPGRRLPATRDLAGQHELARGTVVAAYEQLKSEGYVEGRIGSGTCVCHTLPEAFLQVSPAGEPKRYETGKAPVALAQYGKGVKLFSGYESRPTHAFRPNLPAVDLFPVELWTRVSTRVLRRATTRMLMGCDPMGYSPLRETIADYLNASRGVRCTAGQIAVVSGIQEALDLTARILIDRGDQVCMENPGYTGAAIVFESNGARVRHVPVDDEGIVVRRLPLDRTRLVYVTPGHQFPLGVTMSLARRLELLEWSSKTGALIFEDDYDCEYRYAGRPSPALQGLDQQGTVLYAGTFSKTLFPSLRLGYMVVPDFLIDRIEAMKSTTNRHAPVLEQAVLHAFMAEGHFNRHVRRMRAIYAERLEILLTEARAELDGLLTITGIEAGLQTAGWLPPGADAERAAGAAAKLGVEVIPLSCYARGKLSRDGLQLGFAAVDAPEIRRGMERLAKALKRSVAES